MIDPKQTITKEEILNDSELLSRLASFIADGRSLLQTVLNARAQVIKDYLVEHAEPMELAGYRLALIQIEKLEEDFESYLEENNRRKTENKEGVDEHPDMPKPLSVDSDMSSL